VDPGLVETGYAVLEAGPDAIGVVDAGVIETRAGRPLDERVQAIYAGVLARLEAHAPAALVLEDLYAACAFPRTALLMAHARGVICLAARQRGMAVLTLAPAEVKRAVAAHGAASKHQIQQAVQRRLALAEPPRSTHVADALALALTGLSRLRGAPQAAVPAAEPIARGRPGSPALRRWRGSAR
jgi:crossover junction endodeoxyribonuclease RuvC